MIAYFENDLIKHLGEGVRNGFLQLGLSNDEIIQAENEAGKLVSFIKITGDFDEEKCTEVLTEAAANEKLRALYKPSFVITNPNVMQATMTAKISDGSLNIAEMQADWSDGEENEWLYNNGVSGITKIIPDRFFAE